MTTNKTKLEIWTEAYGEFSVPLQRRLDKMVNDYAKDMGVGLAQEISERSLKGFVGKRYLGMAGVRDPYTIKHIDEVIEWARSQVRERHPNEKYELSYRIFGKNGVMGDLEPIKETKSHELLVVVEGVSPDKKVAEEATLIGTRQIFYARLPEVKGTAGTAAFVLDEVTEISPAYRWTLNHTVEVDDPLELFPITMIDIE